MGKFVFQLECARLIWSEARLSNSPIPMVSLQKRLKVHDESSHQSVVSNLISRACLHIPRRKPHQAMVQPVPKNPNKFGSREALAGRSIPISELSNKG